jgi:hypothetical protein
MNSDYFPKQHPPIGLSNGDAVSICELESVFFIYYYVDGVQVSKGWSVYMIGLHSILEADLLLLETLLK